jgi:Protein of unknown function (DUF3365)
MPKMGIRVRFTLVLSLIFVAAIIGSWAVFSPLLQHQAEGEIAYRAQLLLDTLSAVRTYTSDHIKPMLADQLANSPDFIKESVPAFSADITFANFQSKDAYHHFSYKEAAPNPTNPNDDANAFELQLVSTFQSDSSLHELSGFTMRDGQDVFYTARPLSVSAEGCLDCHGSVSKAPTSLINTYGTSGGFDWQMGQIVAAQTVYVPASDVFQQAQDALNLVMGILVAIFGVVIIVTTTGLRRVVVLPVVHIARLAQLISSDALTPESTELAPVKALANRSDEIGATAAVLQKMASEIYAREQKLKMEVKALRIQVDWDKQAKQVEEITESDYFQNLQKRIREMRTTDENPTEQPKDSEKTE